MKKTDKIIYILFISLLLLIFFSCSRKAEIAEPVVLDTVITFVSGEAYIIDTEGGKREAEIGERLLPEYELVTMQDSFLEFKIGSSGVIRMDSDTSLSLLDFSEKTAKDFSTSDITLSLAAGAVIQKVKKLTGNETYHVKTASAAFGVRGTEFLVRTDGGSDTLAVKSGSVLASLFPEQLEKLKGKADSGDEDYINIYRSLEESFPLVGKGEEISIAQSDIEEASDILSDISVLIDKGDSGELPKDEVLAGIRKSIFSDAVASAAAGISTAPVSEENIMMLRNTDNFLPEQETPDTELYIKTDPSGAAVYFDGSLAGYGSLKALFSGDRVISIRVEKEGYYPFEKEIRASDIKDSPYLITLEKKAGSVSLKVVPGDSEISIEGIGRFKGKYSGSFNPGTEISVSFSREEYIPQKAVFLIEENSAVDKVIVLKPMLIPLRIDTGLENGSFITRAGDLSLLSAGSRSGFSFFSEKGEKKWNISAEYTGKPVIGGGKLVFLSGSSLDSVNLSDGSSSGSIELEASNYMDPEYYEGYLFINSGNDVLKINPEIFEKERIYTMPDMTVSNPYYYKGKLFSVTDKGVLHIYGEKDVADSAISVSRGNPEGIDIAASDDTVYFAGIKGEIFAMNTDTAEFLWDGVFESEGKVPEIRIERGKLVLETGRRLNFYSKQGQLLFSPEADIDAWTFMKSGEIAYVTGGNNLVICNGRDGSILRQGAVEDGIRDLTVIGERLYAVRESGDVIALNPDAVE